MSATACGGIGGGSTGGSTAESLRILLVDDEHLALRRLASVLSQVKDVEVVGTASNGEQAVDEVKRLRPDLVILDVEMPGRSGLSAAEQIERSDGTEIVILSAFDKYAAHAFEIAALDYLLKPLRPDRLRQALDRARTRRTERAAHAAITADLTTTEQQVIHVPDRNGGRDVAVRDVVWIEAARDYALIHTRRRSHMLRATMAELATRLPDSVMRVHRSAFVALSEVRRWAPPSKGVYGLVLSDGTEIAVGPSYVAEVREALRSL